MKVYRQYDGKLNNPYQREVYKVFHSYPNKIFSKDEVIDICYNKNRSFSKLTLIDALLDLVRLGYLNMSISGQNFAMSPHKNPSKIIYTLTFKVYETTDNN